MKYPPKIPSKICTTKNANFKLNIDSIQEKVIKIFPKNHLNNNVKPKEKFKIIV